MIIYFKDNVVWVDKPDNTPEEAIVRAAVAASLPKIPEQIIIDDKLEFVKVEQGTIEETDTDYVEYYFNVQSESGLPDNDSRASTRIVE